MEIFPILWAASTCKITPLLLVSSPIESISVIVPNSLFICMSDTNIVLSVTASATCSTVISPDEFGSKYVTSKPSSSSCLKGSRTALCSIFEVTR